MRETEGEEKLLTRVHGDASLPTLVYLPGIHGDWTLIPSFRACVAGRVRFVEFIYPRTLEWSLEDYSRAIGVALKDAGITQGWLLGESFGSQLVWPFFAQPNLLQGFNPRGIILAGGFVRYPLRFLVTGAEFVCSGLSLSVLKYILGTYAVYARFRHRHAPETRLSVREFVARRTSLDKLAAQHRLRLIRTNNPEAAAMSIQIPLYHLAGAFDPIVPWGLVRSWLAEHCPSYRGSRIIWQADHSVLITEPRRAADQIIEWIRTLASSPQISEKRE